MIRLVKFGKMAAVASVIAWGHGAQAGETTNSLGITMVDIPAGEFVMGGCQSDNCLEGRPDPNAESDETPQHRVQIQAFKISKTEVTLGQFKKFMAAENRIDLVSADFLKYNRFGDDAPVVFVSWDDAQAFIAWLNKTDGKGWRLPSEAEWEYACRAGQRQTYCGSDDINTVAWFKSNSNERLHPVGKKRANAWGLYDMSGNVWEWVQDCPHSTYAGAPTDGSAWTTGCDTYRDGSTGRGLRGGSWSYNIRDTRAANRDEISPDYRSDNNGFRLARTQ